MAAAAGLPSWLIRILGRWRSDTCERYIHLHQATILDMLPTMAAYHQTSCHDMIFTLEELHSPNWFQGGPASGLSWNLEIMAFE